MAIILDSGFDFDPLLSGTDRVFDQRSELERQDPDLFEGIDMKDLAEACAIAGGEHAIPRLLGDAHGRALFRFVLNYQLALETLRTRYAALDASIPKQ